MDESSFIGPSKGLQKIMLNSKSAFIHMTEVIFASDEYKNCKIELIPWQQRLGYNTIIIQKSSPFEQFMKQVILDIYSKGILSKLQQKWSIKETYCEEPDIKPISPQKVFICFIWVLCGMVTALIMAIVEKCISKHGSNSKTSDDKSMAIKVKSFVDDIFKHQSCSKEKLIQMIISAYEEKSNEKLN